MNIFRIKSFAALIFLSVAVFGCSKMLNKSYVKSIEEARDDGEYFVITNEGKKITGSKMKVSANERGYGYVVLDGKRHKTGDLAALQKKDGYYGRFGYTWAPRFHKGSIEAYETHQTTFSKTLYPEREAKTTYAVILIKTMAQERHIIQRIFTK